jgi:hypothetical protein
VTPIKLLIRQIFLCDDHRRHLGGDAMGGRMLSKPLHRVEGTVMRG